MIENVEGYEFDCTGDIVTIKFTNLFGEGEEYYFTVDEAKQFMIALALILPL